MASKCDNWIKYVCVNKNSFHIWKDRVSYDHQTADCILSKGEKKNNNNNNARFMSILYLCECIFCHAIQLNPNWAKRKLGKINSYCKLTLQREAKAKRSENKKTNTAENEIEHCSLVVKIVGNQTREKGRVFSVQFSSEYVTNVGTEQEWKRAYNVKTTKWDNKNEKQILFNFLSCEIHRRLQRTLRSKIRSHTRYPRARARSRTWRRGTVDTL